MSLPIGRYGRSGGWYSAIVQSGAGYVSAILGLTCELAIAIKFGASRETDAYRWAGLASLYVNNIVTITILPVLLRGRIVNHVGQSRFVILQRYGSPRLRGFSAWVRFGVSGIGFLLAAVTMRLYWSPDVTTLVALGLLVALSYVAFCIMAMPAFYYGFTWINVLANAGVNAALLSCVLVGRGDFILLVGTGMAIGAGGLLISMGALELFYHSRSFDRWMTSEQQYEGHQGLSAAVPPLVACVAQAMGASLYYGALSRAGPGFLSLYILAQKGGLLLAIPGTALFNKYLHRERGDSDAGSDPSRRAAVASLPMLLVAPSFAVLAYAILCHVYKINPGSHSAFLMARASSASAGFYPLSLCAAMLSVSRRAGRFTIVPTILGTGTALGASVLMFTHRDSVWLLAAPAAATGIASAATMAWVTLRSSNRPAIAPLALACSSGMVIAMSAMLSSASVEVWLEGAIQAAQELLRGQNGSWLGKSAG